MDLDRGILDMIDSYVSEACETTGTRKKRTSPVLAVVEPPALETEALASDAADDDDLIPVEIEVEELNAFAIEPETAWMAPAFTPTPDPIPELSRVRTARGSVPPADLKTEVELDDEITNLVGKPTA